MKNVLVFGILCFALQTISSPIRLKRSILEPKAQECVEQLNLDSDEIQMMQNQTYVAEDDENYIRFVDCYWKKVGYLSQNGELNLEYVKRMIEDLLQEDFDPDTSKSISVLVINKCKDIEGDSHGQKAIRIGNCIMKNIRQILVALLT